MEPAVAADHLQTIRTLMERSALYRRALAPITTFAGILGLAAAAVGHLLSLTRPALFVGYWFAVAALGLTGAFLMVRRQAWQQAEPFWSPPTRRVAQAMLPALTAGCALGVAAMIWTECRPAVATDWQPWVVRTCLPLAWAILYGCALHAAGFYTTRGMRLFGYLLIAGGCAGLLATVPATQESFPLNGWLIMGFFFGLLHLAYGVYLYFTEPRRTES